MWFHGVKQQGQASDKKELYLNKYYDVPLTNIRHGHVFDHIITISPTKKWDAILGKKFSSYPRGPLKENPTEYDELYAPCTFLTQAKSILPAAKLVNTPFFYENHRTTQPSAHTNSKMEAKKT